MERSNHHVKLPLRCAENFYEFTFSRGAAVLAVTDTTAVTAFPPLVWLSYGFSEVRTAVPNIRPRANLDTYGTLLPGIDVIDHYQ